jgi:hypothetical protein
MPTRRTVLRAAAAAGVSLAAGSRTAAAQAASSPFDTPDAVTISFDRERLDRYAPYLQLSEADEERFLGLYGWVAESERRDTDVLVYWAEYVNQVAPWYAPGTGHWGDREPVAVEVDPDTGELVTVRASIYHWIKGELPADAVARTGTHPRLRVIDPWHQYTAAAPGRGQRREVLDLRDRWQAWLDNGLDEAVVPGASRNPWVMRSEPDWWQSGEFGIDVDVRVLRLARRLGFGAAGSLGGELVTTDG